MTRGQCAVNLFCTAFLILFKLLYDRDLTCIWECINELYVTQLQEKNLYAVLWLQTQFPNDLNMIVIHHLRQTRRL